jgi:HK97 family phage prohead protease
LLGRTRSGTLKLSEDDRGLRYSIQLPDTQHGNDVLELMKRGDLGGASFGFSVPENGGETWDGPNRSKRTLHRVSLVEISLVSAFPAYEETALDMALRHANYEKKHQTGRDLSVPDYRSRILILAELNGLI